MRMVAPASIAFVAAVNLTFGATAAEITLETVLARAAAYVVGYQKSLQGVVSEEVYRQNYTTTPARGRPVHEGVELKSDVLMVKLEQEDFWMQFRDVFEVNRTRVRDRDRRLEKLFINPKADARAQAELIQAESARYNIGPVSRTINIPIMALLFLESSNRTRVHFERSNPGVVRRFERIADADAIWMLEFREIGKGTMVKGVNGRDVPSHGRIWLDATNGRVLRTELITEDIDLRALVDVTYGPEPSLDMLVPGEMREMYLIRRNQARIDGRANYSKFRRFTVSTTEKPKSGK